MTVASKISAHNKRRGIIFILSSASGTGKTTLASKLIKQIPGLSLSVSVTTRTQQSGEKHGRDYFFVTQEAFKEIAESGQLLEQANFLGNRYGTLTSEVKSILRAGGDILFVLDPQGAESVKTKLPKDVVTIFILPPSRTAVEQRLYARRRESEAERNVRLQQYTDDIGNWVHYDYVVVNAVLEECVKQISEIIHSERLRCHRQTEIAEHITNELQEYGSEAGDTDQPDDTN